MDQFEGVPENRTEKKNYESMSFHQLEADPIAGPVLQRMSLEYLKTHDSDWFYRKFTGELDKDGCLIAIKERNSGTKPSSHISGFLNGPSEKVTEMTKAELKRLGLT